MRCYACDKLLNDFESTRKSKVTGEYMDMCNKCFASIAQDVIATTRQDFEPFDITDEDIEFSEDALSYGDDPFDELDID